MGIRTNAQAGDVSTRSAHSPVRTSDNINMSLGSGESDEPVGRDALQDGSEDASVQIGEDSYVGDEETDGRAYARFGARTRAIDLWD